MEVTRLLPSEEAGDLLALAREIAAADAVLYLVRACTLNREAARGADEPQDPAWARVQLDAARLASRATASKRVVLVVTHTDHDPDWVRLDPADYVDRVGARLAGVRDTIGPEKVRVAAGSLVDEESSGALTDLIVGGLL